jgi:hypothetical protein
MKMSVKSMLAVPAFATFLLSAALPAAGNERGPDMVIAAAEEAAHADVLAGECRFDDAEQWMQQAIRMAKDARSDDKLGRDIAGSAVGQMTIKLDEFRRQRKAWDRALADARLALSANHLDAAHASLDQAGAPSCDSRFAALRDEIESRAKQAAEWARKGDDVAARFPGAAHDYYLQAQALDPDQPGLHQKLIDVERRIPGLCTGCDIANTGNRYVQQQQANGSSR